MGVERNVPLSRFDQMDGESAISRQALLGGFVPLSLDKVERKIDVR